MQIINLPTAVLVFLAAAAEATTCTITNSNLSKLSNLKSSCSNIIIDGVTVPAGTTLDLTDLNDNTVVTFQGTTSFEYKAWDGPLISVSGKAITVTGATGNVIDGNGAKYWDGKGSNTGGSVKPKFFSAHSLTGNSVISYLNIKNSPVQMMSIYQSSYLTVEHINYDNSAGDVNSLGHNTDAFDIGASDHITIENSIVKNQDDCLAINSGTNIKFLGNQCSGGHGISIGSVGGRSDNIVQDVTVSGCSVTNSQNGIRIKTVSGATGKVDTITFEDITMSEISKYGIVIEGDYENSKPTGTATGGVPITNLVLNKVTGTVKSTAQDVYILVKNASSWSWSGVSILGGKITKSCSVSISSWPVSFPVSTSSSSSGEILSAVDSGASSETETSSVLAMLEVTSLTISPCSIKTCFTTSMTVSVAVDSTNETSVSAVSDSMDDKVGSTALSITMSEAEMVEICSVGMVVSGKEDTSGEASLYGTKEMLPCSSISIGSSNK
ncbi:hypothetical protein WICPIJ_000330 [Wickerhamomyces pijperi]|uniref:endo-polygalacturonase n=1 Tax=Wickerhamomyces pijperi TaxID=599730 RepID=A0A9P8TQY2_WICPI|nr:hypothetical protein WICPIJ_000330 [Wickerhamomyces pijperi]